MKESFFQVLYEKYHNASREPDRKKALEELHQCVYQYAVKRFQAEPDLASDFYLKMYDRIESFFHEYDPARNISFLVYISTILRANYMKFFAKKREKESIYYDHLDWDLELYTRTSNEEDSREEMNESLTRNRVLEAMSFMEIDDEIILRLHFAFYLLLKQIRFLLKRHQTFYFFVLYREYANYVKKFLSHESERRNKLLEKIQYLDRKISSNSLGKSTWQKMSQAREKLYELKSPIPLRMISSLVKKSISQVHRQIRRSKDAFKRVFLERFGQSSSLTEDCYVTDKK